MLTPLKAIRAKCVDCSCGNMTEVNRCPPESCPLHPYRFGKNPNLSRKPSPAQLEALQKGRVAFLSVDKVHAPAGNLIPEGKDTTPDKSTGSA